MEEVVETSHERFREEPESTGNIALRAWMAEQRVSCAELAKLLGVHPPSVDRWVGDLEESAYNKHAAIRRITGVVYVPRSKRPGFKPGRDPHLNIVGPHMVGGDGTRERCEREPECLGEYVRRDFKRRNGQASASCPVGCRYFSPAGGDELAEQAQRRSAVQW